MFFLLTLKTNKSFKKYLEYILKKFKKIIYNTCQEALGIGSPKHYYRKKHLHCT